MKPARLSVLMFATTALVALQAIGQTKPTVPPPVATLEDLKAMYSAAQYKLCLQQASRSLAAKNKPISRAAVQLVRGDCLLQLEDASTARQAYVQAENEAKKDADNSDSRDLFAQARATRLLISASKGGAYDAGDGSAPIKLTDTAQRPTALQSLLAKKLKEATPELEKARAANDLPTIAKALPEVMDIQCIELAATGKQEQAAALYRELGQRGRTLIDRELRVIDEKVNTIQNAANSSAGYVTVGGGLWWGDTAIRRGLYSTDRDNLRGVLTELNQINEACEHAMRIARNTGGQPQGWDELVTRTTALAERTQGILDND